MSMTGLSVLLAVLLLNIHVYGLTIKPVSPRLRRILFHHLAPILHVQLHRGSKLSKQNHPRYSTMATPRRSTTIYNAIFLNDRDLLVNNQQNTSTHTFQSTTVHGNDSNTDSSSTSDIRTASKSLDECKRLLTELNRLVLRPTETQEEDMIIRDWQNVALVIDRCLFVIYILITMTVTVITLVLAPLLKTIPKQPNYHQLNITVI